MVSVQRGLCHLLGPAIALLLVWSSNSALSGAAVEADATNTSETHPDLIANSTAGAPQPGHHGHQSRRRLTDDTYFGMQKLVAPDAASDAYFGYSVATDGNYIVVGSFRDGHAGAFSGSAYIYAQIDVGAWDFVQKIVAPDAYSYAYFGWSVAVDGIYIVVGALRDDFAASSAGAVYIYRKKDGDATWTFAQRVVAPDATSDRDFGMAVAIDGKNFVVGDYEDDSAADSAGSAYIYRLTDDGATWKFTQKIVAPDAARGARFGDAVAIDGNYIAIGASWESDGVSRSGSAHIFRTIDGGQTWMHMQKLVAADADSYDFFGLSLTIEPNRVAVGTLSGAAYLYALVDDIWTQTQKIVPPDFTGSSLSVAMSGNSMVIGALSDDAAASSSGSAYVYRRKNGDETWDFVHKLVPSELGASDYLGRGVAIDGSIIVVGAEGHDGAGLSDSGSVFAYHVFTRDDTYLWPEETQILLAPDANASDHFGFTVAIDGNYIVVGADGDDNDGPSAGSAYIYNTTDGGANWDFVQKIVAMDADENDHFGSAVAIKGNYIVVGASGDENDAAVDDDDASTFSGSAYIYRTTDGSASWKFVQKIVAPDADANDYFGDAVAIDDNYIVVGAWGDDSAGSTAGAAYIYRTADGGTTWDFVQKIVASDADEHNAFGYPVAIDGNYIVVGAVWDDGAGSDAGAAYVYRRTEGTEGTESWVQILKLVAADADSDRWFGWSVAIEANVIAIGTDSAGVHVFFRSNGRWSQTQKIVPPNLSSNSFLYVAISGDSMLIGASTDDDAATDSGSAYLYRTANHGETWDFVQKIFASDGDRYHRFGRAIAIDGKSIVVGAFSYDAAGISNSGSAYTYQLLTCASMTMFDSFGDGWNGAFYDFRNALSGDIIHTGTLALGSSGSDEICLGDGCYTLEVGAGDFQEEITWSFAPLSGGAPYGPAQFVANEGGIFENSTCNATD